MPSTPTLDRLRHAIAATMAVPRHGAPAPPAESPGRPPAPPRFQDDDLPPIAQILRGDWHETPHGPVFLRDDWFPLDHAHGAHPLGAARASLPPALPPPPPPPDRPH